MKQKKLLLLVMILISTVAYSQNSKSAASGKKDGSPKYQLHTTSATKKIVVSGGAKRLFRFSCGVACVEHQNGWFVIDKQGNKLFDLPQGYRPVGADYDGENNVKFSNDRLMIYKKIDYTYGNVVIIDKRGAIVKDLGKVVQIWPFVDGVGRIVVRNGFRSEASYINTNGQKIAANTPNSKVYNLRDGLRCYEDPQTKKWGFTDANCNIVIPAKFQDVGSFQKGLAQAKNSDGLWGYINKSGAWAIQPQYSRPVGAFRGPYALVYDKSGCSYYLNQSGKLVWQNPNPRYTKCDEFRPEGYAVWIMYSDSVASAYAPMAIVNSSFNRIGTIDRRVYDVDANGHVAVSTAQWFQWQGPFNGNKLFDWQGNLLLDFDGSDIFSEGICTTWQNRKANSFYFNDRGEIIVTFEDTKF